MKRRYFLQYLPGLGFFLLDIKKAFSSVIPNFLLPQTAGSREQRLLVYPQGESFSRQIEIWWRFRIPYVGIKPLTEALQYHTYFNERKKKVVVYLPHNKILFTAGNPFVLIDNETYQMAAPALWRDGDIFIPVNYAVPLINQFTNIFFEYDESRQLLRIGDKKYNVAGVDIESKDNGTVIRIRTSRKYQKGEMTMDMRYGWLHIDLFKSNADINLLKKTPPRGLVRQVNVFQFKELLSVAFKLRNEPLSREIYQDPFTNEVVVVLRTREELAEQEPDEKAEASAKNTADAENRSYLDEEKKRWLIDTVVIDPGHGGKDPGTVGVKKLYEKDVVLAISLKLGSLIEKNLPGVKVIYTRKTDKFIPLQERTQIANEKNGKVFISIHANSNPNRRASGFETYILGPEKGERAKEVVLKENSVIRFEDPSSQKNYQGINMILATMAQSAFMKQSEHLASLVQEEMGKRLNGTNMKNRGVKQGAFWVMVGASMPSILVETGFISNSNEARILKNGQYQQKIAEGIFAGLNRFKEDFESAI